MKAIVTKIRECEAYPCPAVCGICGGGFRQEQGEPDEYGHPIVYVNDEKTIGTAIHADCRVDLQVGDIF